jgi:hypothetical protein
MISKPLLPLSSCHVVAWWQISESATSVVVTIKLWTKHMAPVREVPGITLGHFYIQSAAPEDFDSSEWLPLQDDPPSEYKVSPLPLACPTRTHSSHIVTQRTMDTKCHQSSFCSIKIEVEAVKIVPSFSSELSTLKGIRIIFNGKTVCKMQTWWYRPKIPELRK